MIAWNQWELSILALVATVLFVGHAGEPYVYVDGEFNRGSIFYLNGIEVRDAVHVCDNKRNASSRLVSALAVGECHRFGNRAEFNKTAFNLCSLRTPVAAVYFCSTPGESRESRER